MDHTHGPDGSIIPIGEDPVTETVVVQAETTAAADVEIAAIEAERDVALAEETTKREEVWQESRVSELEGELRGIRETLDKLTAPPPEPAPAPVIVAPPADPEPELAPAPEPDQAEPPAETKSKGFWGPAYH